MPLLRIAWRDLSRHRARTLVALLLFALPIALIVGFGSFSASKNKSVVDDPFYGWTEINSSDNEGSHRPSSFSELSAALGEAANSALPAISGRAALTSDNHETTTWVSALSAAADGTAPPIEPGTIILDQAAAWALDATVGDTVSTKDGRELTVKTILRESYGGSGSRTSVLASDVQPVGPTSQSWLSPLSSSVLSIAIYNNARSDATDFFSLYQRDTESSFLIYGDILNVSMIGTIPSEIAKDPLGFLTGLILIVALITLVSAVITPVFAISARRLRRQLALLATNGGAPKHLRRVMLYEGLIVGILGSAIGLALSIGMSSAAIALTYPGHFIWAWDIAVLIVLIALICGITSALVPAIKAGKESPIEALDGGSTTILHPWRVRTFFGLPFIAVGIFFSLSHFHETPLFIIGAALSCIGVIFSAGILLRFIAKAGAYVPTASRLAMRDASRNSHRTTPAIAGIAGISLISTMILTMSFETNSPPTSEFKNTALIVKTFAPSTATSTKATIATTIDHIADIAGTRDAVDVYTAKVPSTRTLSGETPYIAYNDQLSSNSSYWNDTFNGEVIITDGTALAMYRDMTTTDVHRATQTLAEGTAIVGDPALIHNGKVRIDYSAETGSTLSHAVPPSPRDGFTSSYFSDEDGTYFDDMRSIYLPAMVLPALEGISGIALSPTMARAAGFHSTYAGTALLGDHPLSAAKAFELKLRTPSTSFVRVITPGVDVDTMLINAVPMVFSWMLTIVAVILVVLLSATESRRELSMISAMGAPPGLLRRFSGAQAGIIATSGSFLGVLIGAAPIALSGHLGDLSSGQWLYLGLSAFVGPVLAWFIGSFIGAITSRRRSLVQERQT